MKDLENQEARAADRDRDGRTALTAHTPGPWVADSISMETGDYGVSQRDLRISICHVHNAASFGDFITGALKRGGGRFDPRDAHTQIANARLIAAAPDMLAALTKIRDMLSTSAQGRGTEIFHIASAAIAKATVIQDFDRVDGAKLERKTGGAE